MKKTFKIIGNVIIWIFVVFAVLITILVFASQSNGNLPSLFGKATITIESPSMEPTIKTGDMIISKILTDEEKRNLEVGDVVTFYGDLNQDGTEEMYTHRIVEVLGKNNGGYYTYITRGDNKVTNTQNDQTETAPLSETKILAKYTGVKFAGLGKFTDFLKTKVGFGVCIILPLALFFLYELYAFVLAVFKMKQAKMVPSGLTEDEIKKKAVEEYIRQQALEQEKAKKSGEENKKE